MSPHSLVASPQTRTSRAGWGWLLLSAGSRFYLVFVGALAACALLPMLAGLSGAVMTWNGSRLTVTLGTASANTRTAASLINATWTPAAGTTDLFGSTTLTTPYTETDNDNDF